jgi:hypothetical protein
MVLLMASLMASVLAIAATCEVAHAVLVVFALGGVANMVVAGCDIG